MSAPTSAESDAGDDEGVPEVGKYYDVVSSYLGRSLEPHREYLAEGIAGDVLDLGGATGLMLPYVERHGGAVESVRILDPNEHYRAWAETKVDDYDFEVVVEAGRAESIPHDDGAFDAVVASQVFCTVEDVPAGLSEVRRVLDPDGQFRFLEHVHSDGVRGHLESGLAPLWKRLADGCHLTRTTGTVLEDDELTMIELDRVSVGLFPPTTYVRGIARPPET
jgi:SAM-dependent methyltransferase